MGAHSGRPTPSWITGHGIEFRPVLLRQRDHARDHHQPDRAALFDSLLNHLQQPS